MGGREDILVAIASVAAGIAARAMLEKRGVLLAVCVQVSLWSLLSLWLTHGR